MRPHGAAAKRVGSAKVRGSPTIVGSSPCATVEPYCTVTIREARDAWQDLRPARTESNVYVVVPAHNGDTGGCDGELQWIRRERRRRPGDDPRADIDSGPYRH